MAEDGEDPASVAAGWSVLDSGAALLEDSPRRFFCATGDERREFLHGQTTAHVTGLDAGAGCAAACLTAQGRPLALFALYETGERLWIATTAADAAATRAALSRFLVADDCDFDDDVAAAVATLAGPRSAEVLARAGAAMPQGRDPWCVAAATIAAQPVMLFSRGDLRVPSVDVLVADAEGTPGDSAAVLAALEAAGARRCGPAAFEVVRIESGTARYGADVDERRLAMEARLEWAIHFAKGCYVGQEVVERAVSRGRLNHELALLQLDGEVRGGAHVAGGGDHDVVTSVAHSPRLGRIALAYLPRAAAVPGSPVTLAGDAATVQARVLEWPRARTLAGRS